LVILFATTLSQIFAIKTSWETDYNKVCYNESCNEYFEESPWEFSHVYHSNAARQNNQVHASFVKAYTGYEPPFEIKRPKALVEDEIKYFEKQQCMICTEEKTNFIGLSCCRNHEQEDKKICKECFEHICVLNEEENTEWGGVHPTDFRKEDLKITMENRSDLNWIKIKDQFYFDAEDKFWRIVPKYNNFRDIFFIQKPKCPFCKALIDDRYYK